LPSEPYYCPFKFSTENWDCDEGDCAIYDRRMRMCGFFSIVVMMKIMAGAKERRSDIANEREDYEADLNDLDQ
jgi:hypothetical protein